MEASVSRVKPYTESVRLRLEAYRAERDYTLSDVARELQSSTTAVSKYLNSKPEGDVESLEIAIEDVLARHERRKAATTRQIFPSVITQRLAAICEQIKKTSDMGLIYSDAGYGKTCGIELYVRENPTTISICATAWANSGSHITRMIFDEMAVSSWPGNVTRANWIVARLTGRNRLLVVDNAHRLSSSGRKLLFDLHDATGTPMALVGNPEILTEIRKNDQQFSRLGIVREIGLAKKDATRQKQAEEMARKMLEQHCPPEQIDSILDLAVRVVAERGHCRSLQKHLLLMPDTLPAAKGDARQAFRAAHTMVLSDFAFSAEE